MEKIKLAAMLADIEQYERDGRLHTFSIGYVKRNGQAREKLRVRKSGGSPTGEAVQASSQGKFHYNVKERGVLLLTNQDDTKTFAVAIRRITHYNGLLVWR